MADAGGSNPLPERGIGSSPIRDTNTVRNSAQNINKSGIPLIEGAIAAYEPVLKTGVT